MSLDNANASTLKPVWSDNFAAANTLWMYENCTPSNGLLATGSAKAYYNRYLAFDTWYHKSVVKIKDIHAVFGLVNHHTVKGAVYIVDGVNKVVNLYAQYKGGALPDTIKATTPLAFDLVLDKEYILEVYKSGWTHTFSITDPQTMLKTTASFDNSTESGSGSYAGKGWGSPGVISVSGSVLFKNHSYSMPNFPEAKVLFIGDSITEGTNMGANIDITYRWCSQLRDTWYKGDAIIAGRGGSTTDDVIVRMNDLYPIGIKTNIVVVLIGTNERNPTAVANWKTKIVTVYDKIVEQGAVPVIAVPPIPSKGIEYILEMRDFILEKGWNTIRFDYATSLNRDGVSYDASLYTDGTHPNKKGSDMMYEQAVIDLGFM